MRELKFRVWDNIEKDYLNEEDIAIDNLSNIFIFERYDKNDSDLWYTRLLPDPGNKRHVIEQFTGLKDKNGTEIYEGDVVKVKHKDWIEPTIHIVKWFGDEEYPAFNLKPELDEAVNSIALVAQSDFFSVKVVGNIHENPELLEEEK